MAPVLPSMGGLRKRSACYCHRRNTVAHIKRLIGFSFVFLVTPLVFVQPLSSAPAGFETTGSLNEARYGHTATLLQDGKVLATGGHGFSGELASAEIYDSATGLWTVTGSLHTARRFHTATLLPNGKVLVTGGQRNDASLASAELYDPVSGTWSFTVSLSIARAYHTATLLTNGKVLVAGGSDGSGFSLISSEIYDPATGIWASTGDLMHQRERHSATLLPSGRVLVAAGFSGAVFPFEGDLSTTELYDPTTETWTLTGGLHNGRYHHAAALINNGKVIIAGGLTHRNPLPDTVLNTAELYDVVSGTWTSTGPLAQARYFQTATTLPDDKVIVIGGTNFGSVLRSAETYDPASAVWIATDNLVGPERSGHTATLLANGKVLVAAGTSSSGPVAEAELYSEPPAAPSLLNVSTRVDVQVGDSAMIGGFIITGIDPKTIIVRGLGPSLNLPGALADPVIEVYSGSGDLLGTNDNWNDAPNRQQISDSGLAPPNDLESAFLGLLNPGAYTVVVRGKNEGTGAGLFEIYDLSQSVSSKLVNLSTRGFVGSGNDIVIAGFILGGGSTDELILLRGLGPSLTQNGVPNVLANPTLELRNSDGAVIASNDDWQNGPPVSSPPADPLESAIKTALSPGAYTALLSGVNNGTGMGLVEVYDLGAP